MSEKIFWDDPHTSAANLVRDTLMGQRVEKVAEILGKSADLLYKAANPGMPQQLNLEQWLRALKFTQNFEPVRQLGEACGFLMIRKSGNLVEMLKALIELLERNGG
jgi:hypothetical protein